MQDRNNKKRVSSYSRKRKYSTGSADSAFEAYPTYRRRKQTSFRKVLTLMTIVFFISVFAIFLFASNQDFLNDKFGENSFLLGILTKLSRGNSSK